ncbi:Outer membrane efflux protein [Prevotella sp. khp1]|uniref:TolC family protein n=1 Tax=Prevotellaceae TaxID=171552 RepID=UPI000888527E|nr:MULTISPECIES: TolC family protein [Prevotellaceae]QVJ80735.1 TolC family protein [Xylanibacter ruminicola]SDQ15046.1 Outer membrane efflux protein [Prevotella sp. khp1]
MNRFRRLIFIFALATTYTTALAQFNESGISAGFFDASNEKDINFSEFHLPPLAVLFENAKSSPQILSLEKARQIAEAEVAKQKRHIFSYLTGHASYSYGIGDMWGNNSSAYSATIYQYQGTKSAYWNIGVGLAIPVEDILDLKAAIKRKRLEADEAVIKKDIAYDQLKLQIATLFIKITNNLVSLKTLGEAAAAFQGAGALNKEEFENGNMEIASYASTKMYESGQVSGYQSLQTEITTDIITLEILTHTPIITNATTEITLDKSLHKSAKEIAKENKATEKRIKKLEKEDKEKEIRLEKQLAKAEAQAAKADLKAAKAAAKAAKAEAKAVKKQKK